jgi:hypothetical protein
MQDQDPRAGEDNGNTPVERVSKTRLQSSGEIVVEHHDVLPPGPPDKQIHARRPLPIVPERPLNPAEDVEGKPESSD